VSVDDCAYRKPRLAYYGSQPLCILLISNVLLVLARPSFSHEILLSWVPLKLVGLVQSGIDVNPESCIRWLD